MLLHFMGIGEDAGYLDFLLFSQCLQNKFSTEVSKAVMVS